MIEYRYKKYNNYHTYSIMIVNRKQELRFLEEKFKSNKSEVIVLWGRRRVGKTYLLKEFSQKHPLIYFLATKTTTKGQLDELATVFAEYFNDSFLKNRSFGTWLDVFEYLKKQPDNKKMVWVVDEFPYLVESDSAIPSIFQKGIDEYLANKNILLVLCGSSITMMERHVLGVKSPLYGRRTGQWKIEPMKLIDFKEFFLGYDWINLINVYALLGGIPFYARLFDPKASLFENIKTKVLKKGELLYEEVNFLLREEQREPRVYFPILASIAQGNHKFGHIANQTGLDKSNLTKYLSVLEDLHFIYREVPILEKNKARSKKGLYFIHDSFTDFWFYFMRPNVGRLEQEKYSEVLADIKDKFDFYVSQRVEKIFFQILDHFNQNNQLLFRYDFLGRQWGGDYEIDIVAFDKEKTKFLCGEIKWQNQPVKKNIFMDLKNRAEKMKLPVNSEVYYLLVSKNGFQKDLYNEAADNRYLKLIDLKNDLKI